MSFWRLRLYVDIWFTRFLIWGTKKADAITDYFIMIFQFGGELEGRDKLIEISRAGLEIISLYEKELDILVKTREMVKSGKKGLSYYKAAEVALSDEALAVMNRRRRSAGEEDTNNV